MFNSKIYGIEIESILAAHDDGNRLMPLAPSGPLLGNGLDRLRRTARQQLFAGNSVAAEDFADCVHSALFLYFSDLQQAHEISQNIPTATGSFLHGIMHRQEPDYSNAKYWFRRVDSHEIFPSLRETALTVLSEKDGGTAGKNLHDQIKSMAHWDPFWFVDQCDSGRGDPGIEAGLREIQRVEWQLLFDYCFHKAIGSHKSAGND